MAPSLPHALAQTPLQTSRAGGQSGVGVLVMLIGGDRTGRLLEVGLAEVEGIELMPASPKLVRVRRCRVLSRRSFRRPRRSPTTDPQPMPPRWAGRRLSEPAITLRSDQPDRDDRVVSGAEHKGQRRDHPLGHRHA